MKGQTGPMPVTNLNGTPLAYQIDGTGQPVVLIHGSWTDRRTWGPLIPNLEPSFQVVSYDLRGHGESTGDSNGVTVHDDVADLAALVDHLGIAPTHLVANSYGSNIALRFAAAHPELVARLVCHEPGLFDLLESTPAGADIAAREWQAFRELKAMLEGGDSPATAEWYVDHEFGAGTFESFDDAARDRMLHNTHTVLRELEDPDSHRADVAALRSSTAPVLLTQGDDTADWVDGVIVELLTILPEAERHVIAGAGHFPYRTHTEEYADIIEEFLLSR